MKNAVQLYTVREFITDKDSLYAAIRKVKELGYDGVEFAGFFEAPAEELKAVLEEACVEAVSCHVGRAQLEEGFEEFLSYLNILGCNKVGLSFSETDSVEKIQSTCELLKKSDALAKERGISLYYHNHDHEFKAVDGVVPIDEIKKSCQLEVDTFWIYVAGLDPVEYISNPENNVGLIHIKDGNPETKIPTALGEGSNVVTDIYVKARELGFSTIIVENDNPTPNGYEDIQRSMNYIKGIQ